MKRRITGFDAERILKDGVLKETPDMRLIHAKKQRIRRTEMAEVDAEEFFKLYWPYGTFGNLGS